MRNKDYDVKGEPSSDKMEQIDEMFRIVFEELAAAGSSSGTSSLTLVSTAANYLSLAASVLTTALINLTTHVTGRLAYANLVAATAASALIGRRSASAGDFEEIGLGTGLVMSGTTLSSNRADPALVYVTSGDETAGLPNSRRIIAGTNVTVSTAVANQISISAASGETHTDGYWTPLTDGDTTQPELIFDSNGDAIMMWVATP